jgi:phospholipid/cholesterol/gamma-HCH transport system substrate-binding protein
MASTLTRPKSAPRSFKKAAGHLVPKAITDWNHKRIGAAAIAFILAIVVGALLLTSNVFSSTYTVHARFVNAVGLGNGDQVLMAGVPVGKVSSVKVVGNHVEANLALDDGVQLPADTTAQIAVQSLLGVIGVNLTPGGDWGHLLANGSRIGKTSVPFEYFEIQNASGKLLSATDARALGRVVSSLAAVTSGDKSEIKAVIDGLSRATTAINDHRGSAASLITAADQLSSTLARKDHQLAAVVKDLDLVIRGLAEHSSQLGQLIDQTDQMAVQTSDLIGRNQPRLQQMLNDLHAALQVVGRHQLDLARSVSFAASAIKGFSSVGKSGTVNTPWANIYTDIVGAAVGYEVFGNCGALDHALDIALGPDPKACAARSGPVPSGSSSGSAASVLQPLAGLGSGS